MLNLNHFSSLVLITGLSGAGRSSILETLADLGFYRIDNLPLSLLPQFIEEAKRAPERYRQTALIVALETAAEVEQLANLVRANHQLPALRLLFVDAAPEIILKRYQETRRPHPGFDARKDKSLEDVITRESLLFHPLRELAHIKVDTSQITSASLRGHLEEIVRKFSKPHTFHVNFMSFGYKVGPPKDADIIIDMRFLKNPHYIPELRPQTGLDAPVRDYVLSLPEARIFLDQYKQVLTTIVPGYAREGKFSLNVCVGCTGGQHRSVTICEELGSWATQAFPQYTVSWKHREIPR